MVGYLKPTTDPDPLSKYFKWVFCSLRGKIGHIKEYEDVHTADFAPYKSKHNGELTLYGVDAVVNLKQHTRAWKHTGGASLSGYHRVIVADLEAQTLT